MTQNRILTRTLAAAALTIGLAAAAHAECYADYKAKQDNPLKLHYGVVQVSDAACANPARAASEVKAKLSRAGWTVLNVLSVFGPEGLVARQANAGAYFLRF